MEVRCEKAKGSKSKQQFCFKNSAVAFLENRERSLRFVTVLFTWSEISAHGTSC